MSLPKLNSINRLSSPMHLFEEDLNDTEMVRKQKIQSIKNEKLTKSPYSIGSVINVEQRLQELQDQLSSIEFNKKCKFSDSEDEEDQLELTSSIIDKPITMKEKKEIDGFAGVFAVVATVSFNKPMRIKKIAKKTLKPKQVHDNFKDEKLLPKFIELYHYTGINKEIVPELPCSVDEGFILQRVFRAQKTNFINKYRLFFNKWFFCNEIKDLLRDMFWFFYLARHGNDYNKSDAPKLFVLASDSYVLFQNKLLGEDQFSINKFQKNLPNLLSQALYAALSECFPDSWVQFNDDYIESIIVLVYFWMTGLRPTKGLWCYWDMQELKPSEQKKKEKKIEEQSRMGFKNYLCQNDEDMLKSDRQPKQTETLLVGKNNETNNVLFNTNGRSPLLQYFCHKMNINMNKGTNNLIHFSEIKTVEKSPESETYQELLDRTEKNMKIMSESYKKFNSDNARETRRFHRLRTKNNQSQDMKVSRLLENRREVHKLSNLLGHEFLKDKDSVSFRVDQAVMESISRIVILK